MCDPDIPQLDLKIPLEEAAATTKKSKKTVAHDPQQDIALIRAAIDGSLPRVKQAIRSGAIVDATGADANGPALNAAAKNGHDEVVKFLLSHDPFMRRVRADIHKKNLIEF
jgi:ankyrin repeat protein